MSQLVQSQKPLNEWTTDDIISWITNDLPGSGTLKQRACDAIRTNALTGTDLIEVTDKSMLKDINVPALFANKLWSGIQELQRTLSSQDNLNTNDTSDSISPQQAAARTSRASAIDDRLAQLLARNSANLKNRGNNSNNSNGSSNNETNNNNGFRVSIYVGMQLKKTRNLLYPNSTVLDLKNEIVNTESGGSAEDLNLTCNGTPLTNDRTLQQSGVTGRTPVRAVFRVHGGSSSVIDEKDEKSTDNNNNNNNKKGFFDNNAAIRNRFPRFDENPNIEPSIEPDCIMGEGDEKVLTVKMECGHIFEPMTLFKLCQRALQTHTITELVCPVTDCKKVWKMFDIVCAADLNEQEHINLMRVLENRILMENGNYKECPGCDDLVEKPDEQYMLRVHCGSPECNKKPDFCWVCGKSWISDGFSVCGNKECPTATVNESLKIENCGVTKSVLSRSDVGCPKLRACPHCLTLVEYKEACKHMQCWSCKEYFCFICLSVATKDKNGYPKAWGCEYGDSHTGQCKLAPVQQVY